MRHVAFAALAGALLSTTAAALAQNAPAASEGTGEAPRGAQVSEELLNAVKPAETPKVDPEESRAAPVLDEAAVLRGMALVGRSRDGKTVTLPPSDRLKEIVRAGTAAKGDGGAAAAPPKLEADPGLEGDESNRQIFGSDDRAQIPDTTAYPFRTIGFIVSKTKTGEYSGCSGTLVGPRTVLTAAHCLYDQEANAWLDETMFLPGMNGENHVPYGGFVYDTTYVVQAFIDNYKGAYDFSVIPYDLGIITLQEPVGESLGWLSYANIDGLGDFNANIVGYPGDKPVATMWRTTCDVFAENVAMDVFGYDCDTVQGTSGAGVYAYDPGSRQRIVLGVNVAGSEVGNTAVRLHAGYVEWINSLLK